MSKPANNHWRDPCTCIFASPLLEPKERDRFRTTLRVRTNPTARVSGRCPNPSSSGTGEVIGTTVQPPSDKRSPLGELGVSVHINDIRAQEVASCSSLPCIVCLPIRRYTRPRCTDEIKGAVYSTQVSKCDSPHHRVAVRMRPIRCHDIHGRRLNLRQVPSCQVAPQQCPFHFRCYGMIVPTRLSVEGNGHRCSIPIGREVEVARPKRRRLPWVRMQEFWNAGERATHRC